MSAMNTHAHGNAAHAADHEHHDTGEKTIFGFWIYLMSDLLIFAVLFATFAVLSNATAGGPTGKELFGLPFVLVETMLRLGSSFHATPAMIIAAPTNTPTNTSAARMARPNRPTATRTSG